MRFDVEEGVMWMLWVKVFCIYRSMRLSAVKCGFRGLFM